MPVMWWPRFETNVLLGFTRRCRALRDITYGLRGDAVGIHEAIRPNPLPDAGPTRLGLGIGDDGDHHMPSPF